MKDNKRAMIAYIILGSIPICFILFLLAVVNVLLLLLGIAALLGGLLLLKQKKPEWFEKKEKVVPSSNLSESSVREPVYANNPKVYMVLAGREDFGARSISVNKTTYTIGRGKRNDFVIEGNRISRNHMRIEYNLEENASYAIDMGSKNGSYLNNVRMQPGKRYLLSNGDQLMLDDRLFDVSYAHY